MKYYYLTEQDPESFDFENYFDEDVLEQQGIAIFGNREFRPVNKDIVDNAESALSNLMTDLDTIRHYDNATEAEIAEETDQTIKDYFGDVDEETKKTLLEICETDHYLTEDEILTSLSILQKKNYTCTEIRGCCQGDWNKVYHPDSLSSEYLDYLEAVYFATGTEFAITTDKVEEDEVDDADTYFDYTDKYNTNNIKEWAAKNIGCSVDEIKIRRISNTYNVKHFSYSVD